MERLGLDPDTLHAVHPVLIYARIKGYGLSGPYAEYRSFDMLAQAAAGLFSLTGTRMVHRSVPAARSPTRRRRPHGDGHPGRVRATSAHRRGPGDRGEHARGDDDVHPHDRRGLVGCRRSGGAAHRQPAGRRADGHVRVPAVRAQRLRLRDGRDAADVGGAVHGDRAAGPARGRTVHGMRLAAASTRTCCAPRSPPGVARRPSTRRWRCSPERASPRQR